MLEDVAEEKLPSSQKTIEAIVVFGSEKYFINATNEENKELIIMPHSTKTRVDDLL
jgi:hypothetical protein